jgi:hypothetical protein
LINFASSSFLIAFSQITMKRKIRKKYRNLVSRKIFNSHRIDGIAGADIAATCSKIKRYAKILGKLKSYHQASEGDYRSGRETYGYDSIEQIQGNLEYISDRFGAAFRLSWLIDVPKEVDRLLAL